MRRRVATTATTTATDNNATTIILRDDTRQKKSPRCTANLPPACAPVRELPKLHSQRGQLSQVAALACSYSEYSMTAAARTHSCDCPARNQRAGSTPRQIHRAHGYCRARHEYRGCFLQVAKSIVTAIVHPV